MPRRPLAHARYVVGTHRRIRGAARSLRAAAAQAQSPSTAVEAAFSSGAGLTDIRPGQIRTELEDFLALVARDRPRRVLEIGTGVGGTLYALAWASHDPARILSLDRRIYPGARRRLYRRFAPGRRRVEAIEADSHLDTTRALVERFFRGQALDLLFIDGDHGYESVRRDYELYAPLVRPGGLVAFHDIVEGPPEAVGDVPRFWREVRPSLVDPLELVESWQQGGYGIGVGRRPAH